MEKEDAKMKSKKTKKTTTEMFGGMFGGITVTKEVEVTSEANPASFCCDTIPQLLTMARRRRS